jgi:cytochrome c
MKYIVALLFLISSTVFANEGEALAKQKACLGCHTIQHVGISYPPALVRVSAKYQGQPDEMATVIRNGKGKMPAHPTLTDAEIKILVNWILEIK